jgi:hypothetical protein
VFAVLAHNTQNVKKVLKTMLETMPDARDCPCADSLQYARLE